MPQTRRGVCRYYESASDNTHLCTLKVGRWMRSPLCSAGGCLVGIFLGHVKYKVGWGWGIQGCKTESHLVAKKSNKYICTYGESEWSPIIPMENRRKVGEQSGFMEVSSTKSWSSVSFCMLPFPFAPFSGFHSRSWMRSHTAPGLGSPCLRNVTGLGMFGWSIMIMAQNPEKGRSGLMHGLPTPFLWRPWARCLNSLNLSSVNPRQY